ncbi:MAG: efflux RND transporter periplasmic adaptor subunit [Gammaproteobacteria bacterium]|nr:efflux RND transporter periplasmic adaptor subunit [Gammaproteobacteria bacterium]MDG1953110.1 efflux RND transporter periplasmic adaptor subunit [Gammaproteobacteria bacterium]MDG2117689.1 efflux RND transporter periplasmic adaptor subunit [Gammaproteobacteria bacterium]|tara:strand:+ start:6111 stop:7259 length:1149 start_codon:yes stop_codon:yes gene_type:complete
MKRVLMPLGIVFACIGIAAVLISNPRRATEVPPEIVPISVRVIEVKEESVQLTVESQGKAQPARRVNVSANVAGPIEWVSPSLEAGGYVAEGEPLIRLELNDFQTAVARSQASVAQAEAEATFAASDLKRIKELASRRLASEAELQNSERLETVSAARLAEARANLNQAELDADRAVLRAPFNSIVASRDVELGQYVNRAQNVALLFDADRIDVRVPLAIKQLGYLDVAPGFRGEFSSDKAPSVELSGNYGGRLYSWEGTLLRTEASIDPNSNTVQSIIRIQQPEADSDIIPLPVGLFVEARIQGRRLNNIITLPRSVLRNNAQVLVVDAENKMSFRDVEILRLEEERVLISAGLSPGDLICISPIQAVTDGMTVQPVVEVI